MRKLSFEGNALKAMKGFPPGVRRVVGQALTNAQNGNKHPCAKPMKGFGGAGVIEISDSEAGSTYRVIYTTLITERICVLHAFRKKSTRGISTPRKEIDLIYRRLNDAKSRYKE